MDKFQKNPGYKNINTSSPKKKETPAETLSFIKRWFY